MSGTVFLFTTEEDLCLRRYKLSVGAEPTEIEEKVSDKICKDILSDAYYSRKTCRSLNPKEFERSGVEGDYCFSFFYEAFGWFRDNGKEPQLTDLEFWKERRPSDPELANAGEKVVEQLLTAGFKIFQGLKKQTDTPTSPLDFCLQASWSYEHCPDFGIIFVPGGNPLVKKLAHPRKTHPPYLVSHPRELSCLGENKLKTGAEPKEIMEKVSDGECRRTLLDAHHLRETCRRLDTEGKDENPLCLDFFNEALGRLRAYWQEPKLDDLEFWKEWKASNPEEAKNSEVFGQLLTEGFRIYRDSIMRTNTPVILPADSGK